MGEKVKLSKRVVDAMEAGKTIMDAGLSGFGARRQDEAVSFFVRYRTLDGRQRFQTIGKHGSPWTVDDARAEAKRILGDVARGADPAQVKVERRAAPTVKELCEAYLADAEAGRLLTRSGKSKKATTVSSDRSRIESHILPLLGQLKVAAVSRQDVERFMFDVAEGKTHKREKLARPRAVRNVRSGKGGASRTVGLLGAMFTYAERRGWCQSNPVHGVTRFADEKRDRRLSVSEYRALSATLHTMQEVREGRAELWPPAAEAIRFLLLTGWRRGEALGLRWRDVDLVSRTARLPDTKTGESIRALPRRACDVLRRLDHGPADGFVFRGQRGAGALGGLQKIIERVTARAGLSGVTAHVFRHSFASVAADGGASELTIAALLGHRSGSVTGRYVHHADAVLLGAADAVAERIAEAMGEAKPDAVVVQMGGRG